MNGTVQNTVTEIHQVNGLGSIMKTMKAQTSLYSLNRADILHVPCKRKGANKQKKKVNKKSQSDFMDFFAYQGISCFAHC